MEIKSLILIFIGSGLGGITRYLISKIITNWWSLGVFPLGTFVVNILASFGLGIVIGMADHRQMLTPMAKIFCTVGFFGGFSTFSTFGSDALNMAQNGSYISLLLYVFGNLILGILAIYFGITLVHRL